MVGKVWLVFSGDRKRGRDHILKTKGPGVLPEAWTPTGFLPVRGKGQEDFRWRGRKCERRTSNVEL